VLTIPAFLADELGRHLAPGAERTSSSPRRPVHRSGERTWVVASGRPPCRAGLSPAPTFHHLRHSAAALAIAQVAHPKAIQARLGHVSITTTLNLYGHLFPSLDVDSRSARRRPR
jgi:integrase